MSVKVYAIRHDSSYPYAQAVSVRVENADRPIHVEADLDEEITRRFYLRPPHQYVEISLVEGFEKYESPPEELRGRGGDAWVQIDYSVFGSYHRPDDKRIQKLRKKVKAEGLAAIPFPEDLRPSEARIGSHRDGFSTRNVEGDLLREPFHVLYVSEHGKYPIVNYGSIPEDIEFDWIMVEVSTYRALDTLPTYQELLDTLERYCSCFAGLIDEA